MAASIGFVIPVLNEQDRIAGLLRYLREHFPDSELTVVDGGSDDRTVAAALPLCTRLLIGEPGRALQMNLGARAATTDYLFFLHADSLPGVSAPQLQACLSSEPLWGFCRVRLGSPRRVFRVIEWFMNQRSRLTAVATGDQMLFLQRAVFERSGGFDPIPLMEDVAYSKRLRRLARPLVIAEPVLSSSRRWEQRGVLRTILSMWCLRLAYSAGVSPGWLWSRYYGR
jgi:rSAM/selenodomain-associated transferase 2